MQPKDTKYNSKQYLVVLDKDVLQDIGNKNTHRENNSSRLNIRLMFV